VSRVLDDIARQSGAWIHGRIAAAEPVSAAFDQMSLAEGLERLLPGRSFLLCYRPAGHLQSIELLAGADDTSPLAATSSPGPGRANRWDSLPSSDAEATSIALDAPLAIAPFVDELLRSDDPTLLMGVMRRLYGGKARAIAAQIASGEGPSRLRLLAKRALEGTAVEGDGSNNGSRVLAGEEPVLSIWLQGLNDPAALSAP
jgi:hypothetical protein